ncbi:hypothetical protein WJX72_000857 [[Myrmecia] bisecta]|uniref:NFACT RNA-binding domain-containing protein n=1 Tax=[Myrmecia] bisecta TaxID=41462 RepID=A0AAW1QNS5_9CHLO
MVLKKRLAHQRQAAAQSVVAGLTSSQPAAAAKGSGRQTFDYTALVACVQELKAGWVPAKVEQVVQSDASTLCLLLRTVERKGWLHLSWHQAAGRLCTGPPPERGAAAEAFAFGEQMAAQLKGLVLLDATMPREWERVACLSFGVRPGEAPAKQMYYETMGKYSNLVLTDARGAILLCGHQVGSKMSSLRLLQVGRTYELPPQAPGLRFSNSESLESWRSNVERAAGLVGSTSGREATVAQGGVRAYQGVSPSLSQELCEAAVVDPKALPGQLSDAQWQELFHKWRGWYHVLQSGAFQPRRCPDTQRFSVLGHLPQPVPEGVHALVHDHYSPQSSAERFAQLHQKISRALGQALKRLEGKMISFRTQLASADKAEATQKLADLIMANLYRCKRGSSSLEVEDWDTGEQLTIQLDPLKPAKDVAEGYYKQARKQRRTAASVTPLLEQAEAQQAYLQEVEVTLQQLGSGREAADLAALQGIQEELVAGGHMKPPKDAALAGKGAAKARKAQKRSGGGAAVVFRRFTSPSGFEVLVGRNNKQNDELTLKVAQPADVWMHARGLPGAHTLLRVPPGKQAGELDIQFAADLAAFFSKARTEGKTPVTMASPADIKRPRGAPPGRVLVTKEKTVIGRPAQSVAAQMEAAAAATS